MTNQSSAKALAGGWGWVIVVASFLCQFLAYGSPMSVGVLYPEWLDTFRQSKGMTAWIGSLVSGFGLIASPICSACVTNFGARPVTVFSGVMVSGGLMLSAFAPSVQFLIFSYGTVVGMGCGLVYAATVTITCQYFDKHRGLALGIITTGTSVGGFICATFQKVLVELYGLEGCLLIMGALALNIMACGGLMRPLNFPEYFLKQKAALERTTEQKDTHHEKPPVKEESINKNTLSSMGKGLTVSDLLMSSDTKDPLSYEKNFLGSSSLVKTIKNNKHTYSKYIDTTAELLQDRVFVALCMAIFLFDIGAFPPVLFIEDVARSSGHSDGTCLVPLVSIVAVMAGAGKLILGILTDCKFVNSLYLYTFTIVGSGVALLVTPIAKNYAALAVLSGVLGFFSGNWSIFPYVTTKIVGMDRLTHAYGILMFFGGSGIVLGPPVVGWIYDWTESYNMAFFFSGACVLLAGFSLLLAALPCWDKPKKDHPRPDIKYTSNCDKVASVA
ncbi:monocarboxylate transporter 9-like [Polyodon spathula]|uniref:monocarboxylate transporter 9-like n=1 Tax=Polyodon spathula TaxID=7913 RepID=UPI001B7E31F1|nr:monocarboxylate transporter 9-like [Polyodon spathula]XP_041117909.1 monocarboxylate transporter 9-like [Polyodon spathula]XP_041117910.1 monocarboxylate transporter 9-like [Polyodon spathula]